MGAVQLLDAIDYRDDARKRLRKKVEFDVTASLF